MKAKSHSLIKYLVLLCILAALGSAAACAMPFKIVPNTQPEGAPPAGEEPSPPEEEPFAPAEEPPQGEEPSPPEEGVPAEGGEVRIEFSAERTNLQPGECTMLFWNAEGGFGAYLNGEPVERSGEREVCLDEPAMFVLGVDTGETMDERAIEIMVGGMPGEEPPPAGPEMNDEEAIKQALLAELGWNESELEFTIGRMDDNFAEGGVNKAGEMGGAMWLAAKDNGQWVIVHNGQDLPTCDAIQPYNFPPDWVPYCWDEASGTSVER